MTNGGTPASDISAAKDQHTPTTRVYDFTNTERNLFIANSLIREEGTEITESTNYKVSLLGTKTKAYAFDKIANYDRDSSGNRALNHHTGTINTGKMYSSQYIT